MFNGAGSIPANVEVALCVPDINIPQLLTTLRKDIAVGAQNCGVNKGNGAFTGETVCLCAEKCKIAIDNGMKVMFAIGEKKEEREN